MRGYRRAFILLVLGLALLGSACRPSTEYRVLPPAAGGAPPPGEAIYAARLERMQARFDGQPVPPNPEAARSYVQTLRRAGVFRELVGPEGAPDPAHAQLELRIDMEVDSLAGQNVPRSVLIGASLGLLRPLVAHHVGLEGEMTLHVRLPGTGTLLRYRARTEATRKYYGSENHNAALRVLMQEVTNVNLRSLIAQLREDRALRAAPRF